MEEIDFTEQAKRPTLLTILCVLTFISSGWTVASNLSTYFGDTQQQQEIAEEVLDGAREDIEEQEGPAASIMEGYFNQAEKLIAYQKPLALNNIIFGAIILFGAAYMWRLNRRGFLLYAFGCTLQVVVPIFIAGMVPILFWPTLIINAIFVGLYATQKKYLVYQ
ncbi:hypothetical protein [Luteibaculum oceani]|uniref:Uncharacterized protein n=1 Tax=Luteibaculum oceani TaxID=1294296 RepID=A0A5C6V9L7_9FLAO|nr:hypothetical protein [Luteibaculum oceani]TXC81450.1 hypothetical protein FRX97_05445 [Luteibaculum oceani]